MVEAEGFGLESDQRKYHEDHEGDDFLDDFELDQRKWPSIAREADFICRNLKHILKQCDSPADQNHREKPELPKPFPLRKLQMTIPGQGHETIGQDQKGDSQECFHLDKC